MIEGAVVFALICMLVLGPLAWRAVGDRRQTRALAVAADIRHVVNRTLGGESLVSVHVDPSTVWRSGRVVLSVPEDWRWLLDRTWARVLPRLPAGYELVVQQRAAAPRPEIAAADHCSVAA
jgi:hypothetical protein